jgi:hypothetical protein
MSDSFSFKPVPNAPVVIRLRKIQKLQTVRSRSPDMAKGYVFGIRQNIRLKNMTVDGRGYGPGLVLILINV